MWRLVLVVSLLCCSSEASVSCKNENGAEVDWFILYKTPKSLKDGLGYVYIYPDNNKVVQSQRSNKLINAADGILAKTLQPLLDFDIKKPSQTFGFISYNDQPPGCNAQDKFGHSKGVVMVEKGKTGVWLIHSTPQFPFLKDPKTFYPPSGQTNAQIFMCVTFNYDQFKLIGKHLQHIRAFSFDHHIPEGLERELGKAANWRDWRNWGETTLSGLYQKLQSTGGQVFDCITNHGLKDKQDDFYVTISKKFGIDLKVHLKVQTWRPGSDYSGRVETVMGVKTDLGEWETGNDHSKWCVATDKGKQLFCIADLNRDQKRWGGALCFDNERVKNVFNKFVSDAESKRKRKHSNGL